MTCLVPPETLTEFVRVITCSAQQYGGQDWLNKALMGLVVWCTLVIISLAMLAALRYRKP